MNRTLSRNLATWLNIFLVVTLLGSLLPPVHLVLAASSESSQVFQVSDPAFGGKSPSGTNGNFIDGNNEATHPEAAVPTYEDPLSRPGALIPRTFALPFTSSSSSGPASGLSGILEDTSPASLASDLGRLPLSFVPNDGQIDTTVHFQAHGLLGSNLFFAPEEVVLTLTDREDHSSPPSVRTPAALRLRFEGANPGPELIGSERLLGTVNYFIGSNPDKWQTGLPTYKEIIYQDLYPGIDLHYDGMEGLLKGTFIVAPGADPSQIRWRYEGAAGVRVDEATGDLLIKVDSGQNSSPELIERAPVAWQEHGGRRVNIAIRYIVSDSNGLSFVPEDYDPTLPLVIDPTLDYSSYLGGDEGDVGRSIAVDGAGNMYITGETTSSNLPIYNALDSGNYGGYLSIFITKIMSASGVYTYGYSTYLGGNHLDWSNDITVDHNGQAYITGGTMSTNFPMSNPLQEAMRGQECNWEGDPVPCSEAVVVKLSADGSALLLSTFLGGSGREGGDQDNPVGTIAVDNEGNAYIAGSTSSSNFPIHDAIVTTLGGSYDAFVTQIISASGVYTYGYSTYLGGSSDDNGYDIAVDGAGSAYVIGKTSSSNFPVTPNAPQRQLNGSSDAFVTKIINAGGVYTYGYSTYLGGSSSDEGFGIAIDDGGNTYVTGSTGSDNFPVISAIQPQRGPDYTDAFVTQIINNSGVYTYGYSTYLGGSGEDQGAAIAVDSAGKAYVTGYTTSDDFPTTPNAQQTERNGIYEDAFVTQIISASEVYTYGYSTYLGGNRDDRGYGIAVSNQGDSAYITGETNDSFTTTPNALQSGPGDDMGYYSDAFVARLVWINDLKTSLQGSDVALVGQTVNYIVTVLNDSEGETATNLVITHTLPTEVSFSSATPSPTYTYDSDHQLVWELPSLLPQASFEVTVAGIVASTATVGASLVSTATVTSSLPETDFANNTVPFVSLVQLGPPILFSEANPVDSSQSWNTVHTADLDGNGLVDILASQFSSHDIGWWKQNSNGSFNNYLIDGSFNNVNSIYTGDIDGDGDNDILGAAYASQAGQEISWWENISGDGSNWNKHVIDNTFRGRFAYTAYLNDDSYLDVLIAGEDGISWWENISGDGSNWSNHLINSLPTQSVYVTDLDYDGDEDVLGASAYGVRWYENGNNWYQHSVSSYSWGTAFSVYVADMDNDGDKDILGAGYGGISWWENRGTWSEHTISSSFAKSVSVADFDSDGDTDILGAFYYNKQVTWWENPHFNRGDTGWNEYSINDSL